MIHKITHFIYALSFITTLVLTGSSAAAQQGEIVIRGTVIDESSNQPIPGATVIEQDNEKRTITGVVADFDGNFAIKIKNPSNNLVISTLGFKSKTLPITSDRQLTISLVPDIDELDEVMITVEKPTESGLLNIAERNQTTSVVTVKASDIETTQAASIDEALQGRMPGVDIVANSGDPGAGMQIRIRGTSSISGSSNPLIVVDGMPYETEVPSGFNFGTADAQGYAALLNIAPTDIESISVLKDAAATAMWGARAAAGVLVINTKRGSVGEPKISYTFRGTYSRLPKTIPMLNGDQYSQLIPEAFMNRNGVPLNTLANKEFQYDPQEVYFFKNYGNNTDWVAAATQTGLTGEHNLSLQGGGEKARYFTSVGYYDSKGVTKGTGYQRINGRLNLDYVVSDRIRFKTDISYTHSNTDSNYENILGEAYTKMPNMSVFEYNERGQLTPNYFTPAQNIQGLYPGTFNPLAMAEYASNEQTGERIVPHFNLNVELIPNRLISTFDLQFDFNSTKTKSFLPQIATGRPITETVVNRVSDSDVDITSVTSKTNFIYTPDLGEDHSLQTILSLQTNDYRYESQNALTSNTASSFLTDPSVPSRTQNSDLALDSRSLQSRNVAGLINAQYSLLDRYILNVGVRADGNSKFGPGNRYAMFPSFSGRWRISGEPFMEDYDWIDDLSIRASYGKSGGVPRDDYGYFSNYTNFNTQYLGYTGVYPSNIQLTNLKWETLTGKNLGFNLQLFNRRVILDVDFYQNRTEDLIFRNLDLTSVSGYNNIDRNVGTIDNQGWEVGLYTTPYKSDKWRVEFNFNISHNQNVIREISEFFPNESGNVTENGQFKRFLQVDNPFGSFYGYRFLGVYADQDATQARDANGNVITGPNGQIVNMRFNYPNTDYVFQPGDAKYEDINKDGNIDSRDVVYLGNSNPKFTGGFGPTVTFDNQFKLLMFFTYRLDFDVINGTNMRTTNMYNWDNQSTAVLSRWRNPGDQTDIPRAINGAGYNWLGSDRYVEDASFLRLRSVTFSYDFGKKFLKDLKIDDARVYITADNLFTFTKYLGQDPEVRLPGGDPFDISIDYSRTPPTRRISIGLSTRF
ncbi:SusC/RagA family TonB-linked outer membrane protein [Leeuwenhoekiella marinoflava]|uniref:TonB-linked SusC/RagA family outer membrane protein n=2 Tax=Leeuwenhoekiella marinoflava TaxID=988 RepID=A0A4Q0PJI0_9FLAO|nr:SusC/RagA family TonB-linked outer membrane protein [Leeuwenhoekiella marinoflava]RXG27612.1 TonB-linked SusC/RagA family outer membrane protein [Leeuwenhoekiella marinoflava]SHF67035.1 TonB-linked outer membrane protein, SusC/RagA family [Leeuwenhoekiella marinoflava DSM 3653]